MVSLGLVNMMFTRTSPLVVLLYASPSAARRNRSRPPGGTSPPPGAKRLPESLFSRLRLAKHTLPPCAYAVHGLSRCCHRLAVNSSPPGAIPETLCYWFWHSNLVGSTIPITLWYFSHLFSRPASYLIIPPSI